MLLSIKLPEFLLVAINLLVLYFILKKVLFKRVTEFMEKRSMAIKDSLEGAEKAKAYANEMKDRYDEQLKAAHAEMQSMMEDARAKASKEFDKMMSLAKNESDNVLTTAREAIERERTQMMRDIKVHVADLAIAAASKVVQANMDNERNRAIVDKFIDEAGAA